MLRVPNFGYMFVYMNIMSLLEHFEFVNIIM